MDRKRYCKYGGCTVDAESFVPEEPADCLHPALNDIVGCNLLVCRRCGKRVRQQPGVGTGGYHVSAEALFSAPDWKGHPLLEPRRGSRLYACVCHVWEETTWHFMEDPWHDPATDPEFPWRCSGHPEPTLPMRMDGASLTEETDLADLVCKSLEGGPPPGARPEHRRVPAFWVCRLYAAIEGLKPAASAVLEGIRRCLRGRNSWRIGDALMFHTRFPRVESFEEVLELAASDRCSGAGRVYPCRNVGGEPFMMLPSQVLAIRLSGVQGPPDALDRRAAQVLQGFIVTPGAANTKDAKEVLGELAAWDADWLIAHASEVAAATPGAWYNILGALIVRNKREGVFEAALSMLRAGVLDAATLRAWASDPVRKDRSYSVAILREIGDRDFSS